MRGAVLRLLLPVAISVAPWIVGFYAFRSISDAESAVVVALLVGIPSFVVTAPLASLALIPYLRDGKIGFWAFTGLVLLIGAPTIAFQLFYYSCSLLPALTIGGPWGDQNMPQYYAQAIPNAIGFYVLCAIAFYILAGRARRTTTRP